MQEGKHPNSANTSFCGTVMQASSLDFRFWILDFGLSQDFQSWGQVLLNQFFVLHDFESGA
jgi:hypothetical protein